MQKMRRTPDVKEQALSKARQRGERTLNDVAEELNMPLGTLKGWLKTSSKHGVLAPMEYCPPSSITGGADRNLDWFYAVSPFIQSMRLGFGRFGCKSGGGRGKHQCRNNGNRCFGFHENSPEEVTQRFA
ncbi:hypothetical protein LPB72_04790 [Hydrogenophaga crassostreae]|uniref:HTH psq-type domain-containing protein n=1 Tax=Hydrogenophaga crassostreae TaxID=1763535 RepID=A0A167ILM1_9BURK|nr:hypothetical protein [Hydrogenophaga crassostreae]AOW14726.1 hypothetical protein LPB072_19760 [Hydrogenophaga crassostreae]OAD43177.1 hypothetical protein LPB72_04790 [Hydrogenophaga crassostreae]